MLQISLKILQDAPFFVFRLIIIIHYRLINSMNLFCTAKNTLVITLQIYRLMVVQIEAAEAAKKEAQKAKKTGQLKSSNTKNRFLSIILEKLFMIF